MKQSGFTAMSSSPLQTLRAALAVLMAFVLVACGGGGTIPSGRDEIRPLSADFATRKAVAYSPFRSLTTNSDTRNSEVITDTMILQDLRLLEAAGFGLIRLFDSSDKVAKLTLDVIRDNGLDIKVMLGLYVASDKYAADADKARIAADNQAEIGRGIALANIYRDIVLAVSVGNETMVSWSFNSIRPPVMAGYLKTVRAQVTQPVTTDDNWAFFGDAPVEIITAIDFVALHTYPSLDTKGNSGGLILQDIEKNFPPDKQAAAIASNPSLWNWRQAEVSEEARAEAMMNAAIVAAKRQYQVVRDYLDERNLSALPILVTETGWQRQTPDDQKFRAHPVNQKMFYDRLTAWQAEGRTTGNGPQTIFYFEAFDEPWKLGDDGWGLFNVAREARFVIQNLGTCGTTWACEAGSYAPTDAVKWLAPDDRAPFAGSVYSLFADDFAAALRTDPYESPTGATRVAGGANGSSHSFTITTAPKSYGWGFFFRAPDDSPENLSEFAAGSIKFWVKTNNYPGKIQIGISTDTFDRDVVEANVLVGPGDYGYCATDTWCEVSIPLSAFVAANPKIDLSLVLFRFVIRDIFSQTGKPLNTTGLPTISLDDVRWTR